MMYCTTLAIILPSLLIFVNFMLGQTIPNSREKPSSFECGFDSTFPSRLPFSLRFFLITVVFLIFDVEITLILPAPLLMNPDASNFLNFMLSSFILILLSGLLYEWKTGALEWKL